MTNNKKTPLIVENQERGQVIVSRGKVADNFWTRFKGLIGSPPLEEGEGLLIVPSSSIHTHFMSFTIDVLYIDKTQQVLAMDENMKPWRMGRIHRGGRFVLELPAGTIAATQTQVGDQLVIEGAGI